MSNRTSEANKAIATAWENEKALILRGQGTRDWSLEQQIDILNRGKAYDEDGKAFEGHHMKSVEAYPEYQGNVENIQLLSRTEHISAHGGYTGNPTNGCFNPITGETKDFDADRLEPCRIINLAEPIVNNNIDDNDNSSAEKKNIEKVKRKSDGVDIKGKTYQLPKSGFASVAKRFAADYLGIVTKADAVRFVLKTAVAFAPITVSVSKIYRTAIKRDSSCSDVNINLSDADKNILERTSPKEHIVRGHGQHYNTRNGRTWKEKDSYPRGG